MSYKNFTGLKPLLLKWRVILKRYIGIFQVPKHKNNLNTTLYLLIYRVNSEIYTEKELSAGKINR
jgi:hypothetical protein